MQSVLCVCFALQIQHQQAGFTRLICLTAGGFWDGVPNAEVAAEGTEVTPSGLRPSRGPSSTPTLPALTTGYCMCPFAV